MKLILRRKLFVLLITCLFFFATFAKEFGPDVSSYNGKMLKWSGAYNYFVAFKSLLDAENKCIDVTEEKIYTLTYTNIPSDAAVEKAFLIWTGAQPVDKTDSFTDNEVTLSFVSDGLDIKETQIVSAAKHKVSDPQGFEFDAFADSDNSGRSYFTYRVDVTDFFKIIQQKGRKTGINEDGLSLYGSYTVSGLDCATDEIYYKNGENISSWAIVFIYSSNTISPKAIYVYDGLKSYRNETTENTFTGFEFSKNPKIKVTLLSDGGNPYENQNDEASSEGPAIQGSDKTDWISLTNDCNPVTDVFNSISSVYGWAADEAPTCIGGISPYEDIENIEFFMDTDTFILDSSKDDTISSHFKEDGTEIRVKIGAGEDRIITNTMIIATDLDTRTPDFEEPLFLACTPAKDKTNPLDINRYWCYSDLEYTFVIRLINIGKALSSGISVKTEIPEFMEYVPNSTEIASKFTMLIADEWFSVPDSEDNTFPLQNISKVTKQLNSCEDDDDCIIFVRYRTRIKNSIPKNYVFEMKTIVKVEGYPALLANLGIPLTLEYSGAGCLTKQEDIDLSECGGPLLSDKESIETNDSEAIEPDEDEEIENSGSNTKSDGCLISVL